MNKPAFRPLIHILVASLVLSPMVSWAGVTIAQKPLSVAEPVAPNIMFIMDDSGSMAWQHMPGTTATWSSSTAGSGLPYSKDLTRDIRLRASNVNTQWYNPTITYEPWLRHDGSSYGNASLTGALQDPSQKTQTGSFDFQSKLSDWPSITTDSTEGELDWRYSGFYVLDKNATVTNKQNYVRYEFRYETSCTKTENQCVRWRSNGNCRTWDDVCVATQSAWKARKLTLKTDGADDKKTDLTQFDWSTHGGPVRTIDEEIQNYANWYSYYRLRITMAKAAASRVFAKLGSGYRLGYDTLHNRQNFPIPVGQGDGLFTNEDVTTEVCTGSGNKKKCNNVTSNNKKDWFSALFNTISNSGTPLREALGRTGEYFKNSAASGPYGPEEGTAQYACRQNFAIMTTDGYWNGNAASNADATQDTDSTDGSEIEGVKGQAFTYKAEAPYQDSRSNTLADVAMYYWKNDLRTDLVNNVPKTAKNPSFWQNMRTFGISIGEKGTLTPNQATLDAIKNGTQTWPAPGNDKQENIDDLWHAAVNSRGEFIVASNPDEFTRALTNTLNEIANETKSEASGGVNSANLTASTKTYFSRYTSGSWNGNIIAYSVDATTGLQDQSTPIWEAEKKLPAPDDRNIYVNAGGTAKIFTHANLTAGQKTFLSADLVSYLRGDRSKETDKTGGTLRERAGILPAFINSQLVYVGAPKQGDYYSKFTSTSAKAYAKYATDHASRTPTIYIAGNNGMLHAFNAETGVEIYAFLPNSSISAKLANYADKDYGSNQTAIKPHQYILDGELTIADAYLDGTWKTILVGTQGRGGTGVFALDVTSPADIKFLWEKSATDNGALGNNLGKPIIAQVADGNWRVILGNGPNSSDDKAQLIMFNLETGAITAVDTGTGTNNGLAAVNVWDSDQDGFFDTGYAGDLQGNVWRFSNLGGSPSAAKLFAGNSNQPITAQPLVIKNQKTGATWVTVGSGQYLNTDDLDKTKFKTQTWYGLLDDGDAISGRSQLKQRKLLSTGAASGVAGRTLEAGTEAEITMASTTNRGWYINFDLPSNSGERMMTPNFILGGALFGISFTPDASDPCQPNGTSSVWAINPFTGGRINQGIFDINGDGSFNTSDKIGGLYPSVLDGIPAITSSAPPITGNGKDGSFSIHLPTRDIKGKIPTGQPSRQSWREVINQ